MASPLSEVRFGSLLSYSPRGTTRVSKDSRWMRDAVKTGSAGAVERAMLRFEQVGGVYFSSFFFAFGTDLRFAPES